MWRGVHTQIWRELLGIVSVPSLLKAGVHFGHKASRWNPKMAPYIFGKRNQIHIIDLRETLRGLIRGARFLEKLVAAGEKVLFVGTKRQAGDFIREVARQCAMPYVAGRWLGGTLTNFETIRSRLRRLQELDQLFETGAIDLESKKRASALNRQRQKIARNLEGIREMSNLPGALIVVDPSHEYIAVKEANKLGLPIIALIDTDSDPELVDICIPGNDDATSSISATLGGLARAIETGRQHQVRLAEGAAEKVPAAASAPPEEAAAVAAGADSAPDPQDAEKPDAPPEGEKPAGSENAEEATPDPANALVNVDKPEAG